MDFFQPQMNQVIILVIPFIKKNIWFYILYNNFKQIVIILTSRIVITWLLLLGIANAKIDFQQQVIDVDYYSTRRPANDKTTAALSWVDYYQRSYVKY